MVKCEVTITMPDGSKGHHKDVYPDTVAATERALELFPQARKIDVVGTREAQVIPLPVAPARVTAEAL